MSKQGAPRRPLDEAVLTTRETPPHRPDRQRTGDPAQEKGTHSAPAQPRLRSLKTSHPPRQDGQINYLDILATFMKQRTYLATLLLFGHLAQSLPTPEKFDLVRLVRFLRTFSARNTGPGIYPSDRALLRPVPTFLSFRQIKTVDTKPIHPRKLFTWNQSLTLLTHRFLRDLV